MTPPKFTPPPPKERNFFSGSGGNSANDITSDIEVSKDLPPAKSSAKKSGGPVKFKSFELQPLGSRNPARPPQSNLDQQFSSKQQTTEEEEGESPEVAAFKHLETPPSISEDKGQGFLTFIFKCQDLKRKLHCGLVLLTKEFNHD